MSHLPALSNFLFELTFHSVDEEFYRVKLGRIWGVWTTMREWSVQYLEISDTQWYFAPSIVMTTFFLTPSYLLSISIESSFINSRNTFLFVLESEMVTNSKFVFEMAAITENLPFGWMWIVNPDFPLSVYAIFGIVPLPTVNSSICITFTFDW